LQQDYAATGTQVVFSRALTYNAKGQLIHDDSSTKKGADTFRAVVRFDYGTGANYALGSVVQSLSDTYKNGSDNANSGTAW
jgi:hypothetical protein